MSIDLEKLCRESRKIVLQTGGFIEQELGKVSRQEIEVKDLNSLVSYVDKQAEQQLVNGLGILLSGSTFLTEEETVEQKEGKYRWIIDPLDGTTNFLHQLPCFAVSVALQKNGKTVMGIVYEISRKECFYAWEGEVAYLNGKSVHVSKTEKLADSLISTGFPYYDFQYMQSYLKVFQNLMQNSRGIRRWGSAATDLAYLACGRFDAFFEYALNAWDVAAGAFIVQQAGGRVSDFSGGDNYLFGREIIATNSAVFSEFSSAVKDAFYSE